MRIGFRSLIRLFAYLAGFIISLFVVACLALCLFFDPNDFKPEISTYLQNQTGLPLNIHGKMHFTVLPWIGLKVEKVELENLATLDEIDLKVPLYDLLKHKLVIHSLSVKGLNLTLIKEKDGKTNWDPYFHSNKNSSKPSEQPQQPSSKSSQSASSKISLKYIDVKDASIAFTDNQNKLIWNVTKFDLSGNYSSQKPAPVKLSLSFDALSLNQKSLATGKALCEGHIQFSTPKPFVNLKTKLNVNIPDSLFENADLSAYIKGNLNQVLNIDALEFKTNKMTAKAEAVIPFSSTSPITFSLNMNELDLNKLQSFTSNEIFKVYSKEKPVVSNQPSTGSPPTQVAPLQPIQGKISIGKLRYDDYQLNSLQSNFLKKGDRITLDPLTATVYQGKLKASITKKGDTIDANGSLTDLFIQNVLRGLNKPEKVMGQALIDFNLSKDPKMDLHGMIKCQINNGVINGIDIPYYIDMAQSLLKKAGNSASDTKQTTFDSLSATLMLHDNTIDNNDLTLIRHDFNAKAEGSIYLDSQTLAYKLIANKTYQDGKAHPNAYPLAIRIKGPIQNPKIEPDLDVYLKKVTNVEFKKQIDKLLGGKTSSANEDGSVQDVGSKVEKEIGKGIKKIFKLP